MKRTPLIAVVAMDGIFPGAPDLDTFWQNIVHGVDQSAPVPPERWIAPVSDRLSTPRVDDRTYSDHACLIRDFAFETGAFSLDPALTRDLDAVHQLTLTAGKRAVGQCIIDPVDPQRVDTILAAIALPTDSASAFSRKILGHFIQSRCFPAKAGHPPSVTRAEALASRVDGLPAALLAAELGFGGDCFTLDAACASSIYAVKLACDALIAGRADMVVSGGVSRPECLYTQTGFSQLQALSASGRCAPFDRSADGLVVGEGVGILVLKRLDDALAHGDVIHGVIHGIGLSNDMRGNLLAPESAGQLRAMRQAYQAAGWRPSDVDLIECHGTGTLAGDAAEIDSMVTLWRDEPAANGACAIGSVKSMIGHLLTAAGAAGMIKTLLALKHHTLPPSINFEAPPPDSPLRQSPFRVQTAPAPWLSRTDGSRRAAVSAFGFGGINAHILLSAGPPHSSHPHAAGKSSPPMTSLKKAEPFAPVAIVGMAAMAGSLNGLEAFERAVFQGEAAIVRRPPNRWKETDDSARSFLEGGDPDGAYMDQLSVAVGEFQLPPNEIEALLPQQLLALKVGAAALSDAGLALRTPRERMGVVMGIGFDFEATNFHLRWQLYSALQRWQKNGSYLERADNDAWLEQLRDQCGPPLTAPRVMGALGGIVASRMAREFRFGGPSFVVSADSASGIKALRVAAGLLAQQAVDAMLVGAVDMAGDVRNVIRMDRLLSLSRHNRVRPFDAAADGTLPGDGGVAMVIKSLPQARADGDRIYAVIRGLGSASGGIHVPATIDHGTYRRSLDMAVANAQQSAHDISYIEANGSGIAEQDRIEIAALNDRFSQPGQHDPATAIALGSVKSIIGHTGAADGLLSLAKAALCLHRRVLPPLPGYAKGVAAGAFHLPQEAQPWYRDREKGPRCALCAVATSDGTTSHVVLEEEAPADTPAAAIQRSAALSADDRALFVVTGDTPGALLAGLTDLAADLRDAGRRPLTSSAAAWLKRCPPRREHRLAVALILASGEAPDTLMTAALEAVETGTPGSHPHRILHSRRPLGADARVAMVYPGSGNHYLGMGRELALRFPDVAAAMDRGTAQLKTQLRPWYLMPWRNDWSSGWEIDAQRQLRSDPLNMIFAQVVYGDLMTRILNRFSVPTDALIGYSLGESAALFAHGVWQDRADMLARMQATDLFTAQLAGPCLSLRRAWRLDDGQTADWRVAVVNRSADQVREAIASMLYVRLLIVNTPDECVIGGLAASVAAAIAVLQCQAVYLDGVVTVHCDAARPVAEAYRQLHHFPTIAVPGLTVYSCSRASAYPVSADGVADSIVKQAVDGFDFPRAVDQAFRDGIRVFIEVGPRASCTRMIDRILTDAPHLAVAANHGGENEYDALLRCLARLAVDRVPLDLTPLYADMDAAPENRLSQKPQVAVDVGGQRIRVTARKPSQPSPDAAPASTAHESPAPATIAPVERTAEAADTLWPSILETAQKNTAATAALHDRFLDLSRELTQHYAEGFELQRQLLAKGARLQETPETPPQPTQAARRVAFDRGMCMEFAVGRVGRVLGPAFDVVDTHRVRVRLPDEPLMLVDRILSIHGEMLSMGAGRIVTEHDVTPGAWYLDGGRAPVCISVEAGQADLFLSSYLGIDHRVKGERAYRLLDAVVTFHRGLPRPGETIRYEISIDRFVHQGDTWMFFFRFEGYIGDDHLITMRDGCAGFFTEAEVKHSGGILLTEAERTPAPGKRPDDWRPPVLMAREAYTDEQVDALRRGDLAGCFGEAFAGIRLAPSLRLPDDRMRLIHRVLELDPAGGRYGLGMIRAEADIHPDDWFLTCHFVDDMVMPGTLMYECCAHTLRVFLQRMGWVSDRADVCYEPVIGNDARLKCRGPVTPQTTHVHYEIQISEIGYGPEPYVIADAHMSADGRPIVFFKDMSLKMTGVDRQAIEAVWQARENDTPPSSHAPLYDRDSILAFAVGKPSEAFGEPYRVFDAERTIARLPGPPYCFMDRVIRVEPPPWQLQADGWITAQYDIPETAWYFNADRSGVMPFCVLLEIALQPCGWLAAYAGSALRSRQDLKFRNLGGSAVLHRQVTPFDGTLSMRCRMTKVSEAAEMIIENFDFEVLVGDRPIYTGDTYFGFFSASALAQQKGLGKADPLAARLEPFAAAVDGAEALPAVAPRSPADGALAPIDALRLPSKALLMLDRIEAYLPEGGSAGLCFIRGTKQVDPDEWFFKAHFYQDPVCPGSLGLESFIQLLKFVAMKRWPHLAATHRFRLMPGRRHTWSYRGQIIPANQQVVVAADITRVQTDPVPMIEADGLLSVDGLPIYKMNDFVLALVPAGDDR